jgi:LDH2 family malate/lactate/ureidoglycolate dehydrogenase
MSAKSPSATSNSRRLVTYEALHRFTTKAFQKAGLSEADAKTGADVLALTDAWGTFTHGTKSVRGYLRRLKAGGLRPKGRPHVAAEGPAWAIVDGDSSLGMVTSTFAMQTAIEKARTCGIAYVGVRNSCHYGAAGCYAWQAAREGFIGLSMANDVPTVAAPGSRGAVTGSSPISYAIPAGRHPAVMLDMSVATVAGGKVYAARTRGESIPNNWLLGADGKPTTDPSGFPQAGALQPAAGHKGYGIALLIETLAGVLTGASITWKVGSWIFDDGNKPTDHGAAFIAIDLAAMMPAGKFAQRMEGLVDEIHNSPRAEGVERIYVPGEMEWQNYNRAMQGGIALPSDVFSSLQEAAEMTGLNLEEELK